MVIYVTKKDIKNGERRSCKRCPVALAVARKLRHNVSVNYVSVNWIEDGKYAFGNLPKIAAHFVTAFDEGRKVKPFRFKLK